MEDQAIYKTKEMFNHIMVDIETMGTESFACIISIGAVEFNIETGKTGKEFYQNISLQSCLNLGLKIDADTVLWWMRQSEESRNSLSKDCISISAALLEFSKFCNHKSQIWGNSPRFDLGLLQNAFNKAGIPICWDPKKERDVRTLVSFNPEIKTNQVHPGTNHNALADCHNQVAYCSKIWNYIHNKSKKTQYETN